MQLYSTTQRNYMLEGATQDDLLQNWAKKTLGIEKSKVTSKRHAILSGPAGVGKTFTVRNIIEASGQPHIELGAGATEAAIAAKLAYGVYKLKEDQELIVLIDDADDIIFADKATINTWKLAFAKDDPFYARDIDMTSTINRFEKSGKEELAKAIRFFQSEGEVGLHIPTDRVRFMIICNTDLENLKAFHASKRPHVEAIVDRVKYQRLDFEWKVSWGWLAHILNTTQPFDEVDLTDEQKSEICKWMWDKWPNMRNTSYRTVQEMAEYMIENPDSYIDQWERFVRKV